MGLTMSDLEMDCEICRWLMNHDHYVECGSLIHYQLLYYSDICLLSLTDSARDTGVLSRWSVRRHCSWQHVHPP